MPTKANTKHQILILEDDPAALSELCETLDLPDYQVYGVDTVGDLWKIANEEEINLFLLDVVVPDGDGLETAKRIRQESDVGIIIITGRGDDIDRVMGLEFGADDYIVKPFFPRELLARVKNVLRRVGDTHFQQGLADADHVITFEGWHLNVQTLSLFAPNGTEVPLTNSEASLLKAFVISPRRVLSRDHLLNAIYGSNWVGYDRSIDGLVSRLRKKFASHSDEPKTFIKSMRGTGYLFTAKATSSQRKHQPPAFE